MDTHGLPGLPSTPVTPQPSLDALLPDAIAVAAENLGVKKASYDTATLFALAILAGAFIALGGLFATVAMSGAEGMMPYGVTRLLGGLVFSLGLILVLVGGAQLFTGDALMVMAWASGRLKTTTMLKVWTTVWLGNFVGAAGTAVLVFLSGQYTFGHGAVGASALYFATAKSGLPTDQAFFLAILCNVLVCLAVWLALGARSVTDKILAVTLPVAAFVAAGFEHCVANMYFVPLGLLIEHGAPASFWADLGRSAPVIPVGHFLVNLAAVTLGNWVGGALLVGGVYWFIYRRPSRRTPH
ncbi:formate/nitrite transporter family protein [Azospirillum rugosum]|uniref:Formate/nitrite transporter n=1 Tax=Azospirillum rugosum TaxID=416170 RepID=A0ABS4SQW5_9PROT|nr:formate/nitrite transporter family protein [Azospirillum rugosum]MBP2293785.1 formate/nitrite transporter [Azospirillum rugosum]MDQ0527330.1 formate/nitrite transporter [Azospirillum rugosum]